MKVFLADRVYVATNTVGTAPLALGEPLKGYQTPLQAGVPGGANVRYVVEEGFAWELGWGVYDGTAQTLTRNLVQSSTGALLELTGEAKVFFTVAGEDIVQPDDLAAVAGDLAALGVDVAALEGEVDGIAASLGGYLPLSGGTMVGAITLPGAPSDDLHASTKKYVDDEIAAAVEPLAGRNLIINGSGVINQRAYASGTATTAANQYTLDRWRVVTSGQSLTWTDQTYRKLMTAPAGGVEQVIENIHIKGGSYTINWEGTATCTVDGTVRAKGATWNKGSGVQMTVRFSNGTFTDVQVEEGTTPTAYESRLASEEIQLCQRYFERCVAGAFGYLHLTTSFIGSVANFMAPKRATPTVTWSSNQNLNSVGQPYTEHVTAYGFRAMAQSTVAGGQGGFASTFLADAEIT